MDDLEELIVEHAEGVLTGARHLVLQALKRVIAAVKAVAACTEPVRARARAKPRGRPRSPTRDCGRQRVRSRSRSRSPRERSAPRERHPIRCFDCFREDDLCPALRLPAVRYAPRDAWCAIDTARRCRRPRGIRFTLTSIDRVHLRAAHASSRHGRSAALHVRARTRCVGARTLTIGRATRAARTGRAQATRRWIAAGRSTCNAKPSTVTASAQELTTTSPRRPTRFAASARAAKRRRRS